MYGRVHVKLLKAVDLLSAPGGCTIRELESELEVSRRTAYRVLDTLGELGFPIYNQENALSREKRWKLEERYVRKLPNINIPEIQFTYDELIVLQYLLSRFSALRNTRFEDTLKSLRSKIGGFLPKEIDSGLFDKLESLFVPHTGKKKNYSGKDTTIESILDAILNQKTCSVTYHSFSGDTVKTFNIDPLRLFEHHGGIYLFARIPKYDSIRMLAIDRIQKFSILASTFIFPPDFHFEALLNSAFDLTLDDPITAKIWFSKSQAKYIEERKWAHNQRIEKQEGGSIILHIETSGYFDLKRWVLSFGKEAKVLYPDDLKNDILANLQEMLAEYTAKN